MRSTASSTTPPTISVVHTSQGSSNSTPLMYLCSVAPTTAAGRKATSTPSTNRRVRASLGRSNSSRISLPK